MPNLPFLPITAPLVRPEGRRPFPKLFITTDWIRYLRLQNDQIDLAARRRGSVVLTAQAAAIAATAIPIGSIPPGLYRISYYARITQAATTSSSLTITIGWTDGAIALTQAGAAITGNTTSDVQFGTVVLRSDANGPVTYSTAYSSTGATAMQYRLSVVAEELALEAAA